MRSKNRTVLPQPQIVTEEIPGRDGVYDFSAANPLGRTLYGIREISVECSVRAEDFYALRRRVRQIAQWLSRGAGRLVFDDEPWLRYEARVANRIDLEQQIAKIGVFTILFSCQPFALSANRSGVIPCYGDGTFYLEGAFYGGANIFAATGADGEVSVTPGGNESGCFSVDNCGSFAQPGILLVGNGEALALTHERGTLAFHGEMGGELFIDCQGKRAVLNGMTATNRLSGVFPELAFGENPFSLCAQSAQLVISFLFHYRYL